MLRRSLVTLILIHLLVFTAHSQTSLQAPVAFLGYELGERFTPHHRVVDYVEHVAEHSPRVQLERYGETYEGRPLMVAYVATPGRLADLDAIRTDNLSRAGVVPGTPSVEEPPALVWLSYNVHGNEAASTEAALLTLYELADPTNTRTGRWLDDVVVILDPLLNPDGRERYVNWYRQVVGRTPDAEPDAREHHEPWPGGRTNHYYFDLNRDWAWATQRETQQRLALYHRWLPHVHVDFHEQQVDAPYYFAPAAEPFHEQITDWQRRFQKTVGTNHMRYFDDEGWLYFTRQVFDLVYPGYGDTWPLFNGAVGMTYEQGGSGRAGLSIRTSEGDTLTLPDRIAHHHTTALSTVETAARHRAEVVREFARYYNERPETAHAAYLVRQTSGRDRVEALARHLDLQGIRYGHAGRARTVPGRSYRAGTQTHVDVQPGDLVVPADQPKGRLVQVLFEPETDLSDSLTYDITAWALPYVYGLDAYALDEAVATDGAAPASEGSTLDVEQPYAYLARWQGFEDLRLLARLLKSNVHVRYAEQPFTIDGRTYGRGTLVVTRAGNEALGTRFDRIVRDAADDLDQPLHAVATGFVTRGADFGSNDVHVLKPPHVAVVSGDDVDPYELGTVWHFFDRQLEYPVTLVDQSDLGGVDLGDYDVLVLPAGRYADVLDEERLGNIQRWVRGGGRLVAMGDAVGVLADADGFGLKEKTEDGRESETQPDTLAHLLRSYAERERDVAVENVPGAIFRIQLDPTHPLAFGYGDEYFTLKRGSDSYAFLDDDDAWNVGVLRDDALVSGFAGAEALRKLEDTLVFGAQGLGRGTVVYLVDNPLFRGFWYDGRLLFGNAIFMTAS